MILGHTLDFYDAFLIESDLNNKSNFFTDVFGAFSVYSSLITDMNILPSEPHTLTFASRFNTEDTSTY